MTPRMTGVWTGDDERWRFLVTTVAHRPSLRVRMYMTVQARPEGEDIEMPSYIHLVFPRKDYHLKVSDWIKGRDSRVMAEGYLYKGNKWGDTVGLSPVIWADIGLEMRESDDIESGLT